MISREKLNRIRTQVEATPVSFNVEDIKELLDSYEESIRCSDQWQRQQDDRACHEKDMERMRARW